jgi:hypothetical protein
MISQVYRIYTRAPSAVVEDAIGLVAIVIVVLIGLSLPAMI